MELTLLSRPEDAARLQRLPIIRAARTGKPRGQAARIVWHDGLDRGMAAMGLALAEYRGLWRLEKYRPAATEAWPPGTDHHVIEEAAGRDELRHAPADGLTPVAAFDGRRTAMPLTIDGAPVTLTLLHGVLRAVAAERVSSRVILNGPHEAVRTLALALAEALPLMVAPNSLAAEALHLADGGTLTARRRGAPLLPPDGLTARAAFQHIIGHLTDVLLHLAPAAALGSEGPEPVHQMRVAVRRARSAVSLFAPVIDSPAMTSVSDGLRDLGQMLGPARDWDVFMTETAPPVEAALSGDERLRALLRAGARRRTAARKALDVYLAGPAFRRLCLELACLAAAACDAPIASPPDTRSWEATAPDPASPDPASPDPASPEPASPEPASPESALLASASPKSRSAEATAPDPTAPGPPALRDFAADVLRSRCKKLNNSGKMLEDLDDPGLHELRLKAKRLRYAAEFFAPLFPPKPAARFIRRLSALQECLGVFNDAAVAGTLLRELNAQPGYAAGLVLGFTAARAAGIRPEIAAAWERFRRREPFWME